MLEKSRITEDSGDVNVLEKQSRTARAELRPQLGLLGLRRFQYGNPPRLEVNLVSELFRAHQPVSQGKRDILQL